MEKREAKSLHMQCVYLYRNAKVVALLWQPCDKVVAIKLSLGCHYLATNLYSKLYQPCDNLVATLSHNVQ